MDRTQPACIKVLAPTPVPRKRLHRNSSNSVSGGSLSRATVWSRRSWEKSKMGFCAPGFVELELLAPKLGTAKRCKSGAKSSYLVSLKGTHTRHLAVPPRRRTLYLASAFIPWGVRLLGYQYSFQIYHMCRIDIPFRGVLFRIGLSVNVTTVTLQTCTYTCDMLHMQCHLHMHPHIIRF